MKASDLAYANLRKMLSKYNEKGRQESANFLNWFLENIYRLDPVTADDSICDQSNDKGIDGIYVDHNAEQVHFFQSKISQKDSSLGDAAIKQFIASVQQFDTVEKIANVLSGNASADLKKIIIRNQISNLIEKGYHIRAIYFSNVERDVNTIEIEKQFENLKVYAASDIAINYIEFEAEEGIKGEFNFDTSYAGVLEIEIDSDIHSYILPVSATSLVKLEGISDGKLFSQNVRYSLGNTPVNKAIAESVSDIKEHKIFSLYHNGLTLICGESIFDTDNDLLIVKDYVVVNGAQSITTFFHNSSKLSDDLRVFVKIISLKSDSLSRKITVNSNNQNAIKPRDLRSNHDLMLRLKAEFEQSGCGIQFEIKRGQPNTSGLPIISNEDAGRQLLSFDFNEPFSCHQIYRVFDDKYAEIFGRREVTFGRIIFTSTLSEKCSEALASLDNKPMAGYTLTRYFIINILGHIMRMFEEGRDFLNDVARTNKDEERNEIVAVCDEIWKGIIVDLNYEIKEEGDALDYKRDLKSPEAIKIWRTRLLKSYEKDFVRGKAAGFGKEIRNPTEVS
jgi:AIPR protein